MLVMLLNASDEIVETRDVVNPKGFTPPAGLTAVEYPDGEDRLAGGTWTEQDGYTPPVLPPKYADASDAKAAMIEWITSFTQSVTGPVPIDERLSWDAKEAAARAYIAETATAAQIAMIEDEAVITGEDAAELAAIIIAKADTFRAVVARVAGLRRKTIALIDAVADPHDYETILASAQTEAAALAADLGIPI